MTERPRGDKPVTRDYLRRAALFYLERYSSSTGNLRRVLKRKALRRSPDEGPPPDVDAMIEETVGSLAGLGLVDDRRYAEAKAAALRRGGASSRKIAGKLAERGIDAETTRDAMAALETDDEAAALRYAERRRLGPWRRERRAEKRDADLAAMGRAGFSYAIARRVVDGEPPGED